MTRDAPYAKLLAEITTQTAVGDAVTDLLASDFQVSRDDAVVRITVVSDLSKALLLSPSSGSAFAIKGGAALTADAVYMEDVTLDTGRTWNFRSDDINGTTLNMLRVQELSRLT